MNTPTVWLAYGVIAAQGSGSIHHPLPLMDATTPTQSQPSFVELTDVLFAQAGDTQPSLEADDQPPATTTPNADSESINTESLETGSLETGSLETEPVSDFTEAEAEAEDKPDSLGWLLMGLIGVYFFKMWWEDKRNAAAGDPHPKAFPGAFDCPTFLIWLAIGGSFCLVLLETMGEYALGVSEAQSKVTWMFIFGGLGAAILEEIIFRGFGGNQIAVTARQEYVLTKHNMPLPKPKATEDADSEHDDDPVSTTDSASTTEAETALDSAASPVTKAESADNLEADTAVETPQSVTPAKALASTDSVDADDGMEEVVLQPESKTRLLVGFLLFSLLFAALHTRLWEFHMAEVEDVPVERLEQLGVDPEDEEASIGLTEKLRHSYFEWNFDEAKAWMSSFILVANSMFWFWLRFHPANTKRSLLPCIIGHATTNLGVFFIKLAQGHVTGFW